MKVRKSRTGYWNSPSATARWLNMTKEADVVFWSAIQMTVQRKMPITERREYAGWKRLTSMVRSLKATSTKEIGPMVSLYTQTHRSSYMHLKLPLNKEIYTQTMLMARHQKMAKLFDEDFWVTQ